MRRFVLLRQMLRQFGIERERVQLVWAAASESNVLAEAVDQMTEQLRALGPLRWKQRVLHDAHPHIAPIEPDVTPADLVSAKEVSA
jgi:hypothetical protein